MRLPVVGVVNDIEDRAGFLPGRVFVPNRSAGSNRRQTILTVRLSAEIERSAPFTRLSTTIDATGFREAPENVTFIRSV